MNKYRLFRYFHSRLLLLLFCKVPLSLIPAPVYKISIDFINILSLETLTGFVLWASDLILTEWPGVVKVVHPNPNADISKVQFFF